MGWLPPEVASALVEHGHEQLARLHAERDEVDSALAVLRPFVDRGNWAAVESLADLLDTLDGRTRRSRWSVGT